MNSNPDVDDFPPKIYKVNYTAPWSDTARKSSFCSPSIAMTGLKYERGNWDTGRHSLEADPVQN